MAREAQLSVVRSAPLGAVVAAQGGDRCALGEEEEAVALPNDPLVAYFDAGLKPKPRRVFYIAGYVGRSTGWQTFNRKWRGLLRRNDLPYFRMTDFVARIGPYKDWSEPKRLAVMKRIVALASDASRLRVAATLLPDDYDRLPLEDKARIPSPYGLCLSACIARTAALFRGQGIAEPVDYVFESGDEGQGTVKQTLDEIFEKPAARTKYAYGSLRFAGKTDFPALQLADILAYETGRFVPFVLGWDTSPVRKGFQAMLDDGNPYVSMLFNFEELSNIARHPETERP